MTAGDLKFGHNLKVLSFWLCVVPQTLHGTAIYAYIDPQNHPNVGIYDGSPMECLGMVSRLG